MMVRVLGAVVLVGVLAGPASGQVTLQVLDSDGRPVPAVRIDVFGLGELFGTHTTSSRGIAELSSERWSEVRRISLSHLAFRTLIVQAPDIPADGVIDMEPRAIEIEGFSVEARDLCPITDDREARRVWSEVASRYAPDTGDRAWLAYLSRYAGSVGEDDLYRRSESESVDFVSAGGSGVIHGGDHTPRSLDDRISTEGYAWPALVIGGTTSARALAWAYAQLDWVHAYHFATPVFGALHNFALAKETEEQTTLVFCGNGEGSGEGLRGSLSLVPGEAFLAADWRFETSDPEEGAGGSVSFASYVEVPGMKPHLVASRGLFFRHDGTEPLYDNLPRRYARFVTSSVEWYLLPSSDRPCNTGITFHRNPATSADGGRFAECVADHWGRE